MLERGEVEHREEAMECYSREVGCSQGRSRARGAMVDHARQGRSRRALVGGGASSPAKLGPCTGPRARKAGDGRGRDARGSEAGVEEEQRREEASAAADMGQGRRLQIWRRAPCGGASTCSGGGPGHPARAG